MCVYVPKLHTCQVLIVTVDVGQEVAEHQRQLEALPNERECRQEEERLTAEIQGLEKACDYHEIDMQATLDKQQKTNAEVSLLQLALSWLLSNDLKAM